MAVKYQRYWDSDEKKYKYRQISGLNEPKKTTKQIYQDSLKTDYKGFTGSGTTSAKERKLESKAKAAQEKTATDWSKSRAGAQGQATTKTAGKTADKVQFDFDNILAPKKAKAGVGTGNDGIDILLGKGVCADSNGLYNNANRQADRITLDKNLKDAELEKNTNIGYNKGDRNKNSETTPAISTNIEEIEKPRFVDGTFYAPFEGTATDPSPFSLLPEDTRAKLDEVIEETRNSSEHKNEAADTEESSGGEAWEDELENLKGRYETEDSINLEDPDNREALHVVQRLAGVDESDAVSQNLINVLQSYMVSGKTDFDFDDYSLTRENFDTLLEAAQEVRDNPHVNNILAKFFEVLVDSLANPESIPMNAYDFGSYIINNSKNGD